MKQLKLKAFYPHFFAIILLILIGFIYFYPTLQGKVVNQSDVSSFVGAAKETIDYRAANEGEEPLWTNSMFSGTLIITGELSAVTTAVEEIVDYFHNTLGYVSCPITKR